MLKTQVIGHLGQDPEMKYLQSGVSVTEFSVASNYKQNGEARTTWINVSCFGTLGETANQHLTKGQQVYVEGRLQFREYTDRAGKDRCSHELVATSIEFLGNKPDPAKVGAAAGDLSF